MRWFLDTEFIDDGVTIKLISIALVSEAGDELYAVASDGWSESDCDAWLRVNVLEKLPSRDSGLWMTRADIRNKIVEKLLANGSKPEIWAYFADYDWVVFCQLFGKMIDLPPEMPRFCRDLKQLMEHVNFTKDMLPAVVDAHDALEDAHWVRKSYECISKHYWPSV